MTHNLIRSFAGPILEELDKAGSDALHGVIEISCGLGSLPNGVRHCSIQIQCKAGCKWVVESFGRDSDILAAKARTIHKILQSGAVRPDTPKAKIVRTLFPEFLADSTPGLDDDSPILRPL